jgi:hypothetical protein
MAVVNIKIWCEWHEESHGVGYCSGEEIDPRLTHNCVRVKVVQIPISEYKAGRRGGICLTQFHEHNKLWACRGERLLGDSGYCNGNSWQSVTRAEFISKADAELVKDIKWVPPPPPQTQSSSFSSSSSSPSFCFSVTRCSMS